MAIEATEPTQTTERFGIPWDLSSWSTHERLLDALLAEIDSLDWTNPELVQFLRANPAFQPRSLLALLSFAYAIGICESEEVVILYHRDPLLKSRLPGYSPTSKSLTRFRRENRGLLKWCLGQLFKHAVRAKYELGGQLLPAGLRRHLEDAATTRLDIARHCDRAVAGE